MRLCVKRSDSATGEASHSTALGVRRRADLALCSSSRLLSRRGRDAHVCCSLRYCVRRDGDGKLGVEELQLLMARIGQPITLKGAHELMLEVDQDGDGHLSFPEFKSLMEE